MRLERVVRPTWETFRRRFLEPSVPVVLTGVMDPWPAMSKWTFEYVGARLAGRTIAPVILEKGRFRIDLKTGVGVKEMDFATYANHLENTDAPPYYLRLPLEGEAAHLFDDYEEPAYCQRRIFSKKNLWVGGKGASSDLHYDMTHNLVAQVLGRRRVLLFPPDQTRLVYPFPRRTLNWHHSQVHVDAPDLQRFPRYREAQPIELELQRGEMLFIPQGWWHHFESLERAIAVNFFWLTVRLAPAMALSRLAWVANGIRT